MFEFASGPDVVRLVAVPVFAWAAWTDIRTRRLPNLLWPPLVALGMALLAWEFWHVSAIGGFTQRVFVVQVALSIGVVAPAGYLFYRFGAFGGADWKALATLAVLFPTFPTYWFLGTPFPMELTPVGVFSLTILTNTVLVGVAYPLGLVIRNAIAGRVHPAMAVGRPVHPTDVEARYGRLLHPDAGLGLGGLDLDALRIYLEWRGTDLETIRADPEHYRDPRSLPEEPNPVGDGAVVTDGGMAAPPAPEDPWGAAAFVESVGPIYGTTPETLRAGLDHLATADHVWISPGIPFIVPMFLGLLVSLIYGDVLYAVMRVLGLA